jgi:predicted aspartyl protease
MSMARGVAVGLSAALVLAGTASGQERKIQRSELPPAVERAVAAQSQGAEIRGFSLETEHGQAHYEVEMTVNGHSKDLLMDSNGTVVEVEEQVALDALPAAVRAGLAAKARGGEIDKVESLTKHGTLVAYEAVVTTNGKRSEIQVGPEGQPLPHEE